MSAKVTYTLDDSNELSIAYEAVCTEDTPINMTNHAYFNLGSYKRPNVLSQELRLSASRYTPIDEDSIPTGKIRDVTGTAFDFRQMKAIGRDIDQDDEQLIIGCNGYDHNFCIDEGTQGAFATAYDPESGRVMEVTTDMPGVQLYTGLETQFYPDSPNQPNFPSCIFKAGEKFRSRTSFKFSVK